MAPNVLPLIEGPKSSNLSIVSLLTYHFSNTLYIQEVSNLYLYMFLNIRYHTTMMYRKLYEHELLVGISFTTVQ